MKIKRFCRTTHHSYTKFLWFCHCHLYISLHFWKVFFILEIILNVTEVIFSGCIHTCKRQMLRLGNTKQLYPKTACMSTHTQSKCFMCTNVYYQYTRYVFLYNVWYIHVNSCTMYVWNSHCSSFFWHCRIFTGDFKYAQVFKTYIAVMLLPTIVGKWAL